MLPYPLPFSRFVISSPLPPEQVETRLKATIAAAPFGTKRAFFNSEAIFRKLEHQAIPLWMEGTVTSERFRLLKLRTSGKNPSVPVLVGTIRPNGKGSVISVFARPPLYSLAFLFAWVAFVGVTAAAGYGTSYFWLLCSMLGAGFIMGMAVFVPQLVSLRRDLTSFLDAATQLLDAV